MRSVLKGERELGSEGGKEGERVQRNEKYGMLNNFACHPYAGSMPIFSVLPHSLL